MWELQAPIEGRGVPHALRTVQQELSDSIDLLESLCGERPAVPSNGREMILLNNANRLEENLKLLVGVENPDDLESIRKMLCVVIPLAIDHFRYFAALIRAGESLPETSCQAEQAPRPSHGMKLVKY